jgi:branched-chain amino acid transport system permease protein
MHDMLQNLVDGITFGSLYALFALGIALVFGIMRLINFAHGELIMVGAYAVVLLDQQSLPVQLAGATIVAIGVALAAERLAFRPVRSAPPATLLITSFALSYLLQSLATLILGANPRSTDFAGALTKSVEIFGLSVTKLDLVTIAVTLALLVALSLFMKKTLTGMQMRAAAEDFRMARVLGVRADRVIALAFALSGLLAAVASMLVVAQAGVVDPQFGASPVLVGFIATVLGGMGSLRGAVVGGFILGLLTVALQSYLPVELRAYRDAFVYGAVILILLVRPQGLLMNRALEVRV